MEQIIIQVKDKQKARALVNFLETLDFVETITDTSQSGAMVDQADQDSEFFALAGLWAGRDISLADIRQKAWPSHA